jgi:two-component system response regulator
MKTKPISLLLVDDDPDDVHLTRKAFEKRKVFIDINVVEDGAEAMAYLYKEGPYHDSPTPDLILLDLNMPKKDGREVLRDVKSDDRFKHIPVIILTTSEGEEDILKAYGMNANCYITKPVDWKQFTKIINLIEDFWLAVVKLPKINL